MLTVKMKKTHQDEGKCFWNKSFFHSGNNTNNWLLGHRETKVSHATKEIIELK